MSDIVRKIPIQYGNPDDPVDAYSEGDGSGSSQNDYVQSSELSEVAFTGDYNDLTNKPSNSNAGANSIFEPLNSEQPTIINSRLRFVLNRSISSYNSVFILRIYNDISDVSSFSGIELYYNNSTLNNFSDANIRSYSEFTAPITDNNNTYYKNYIKYSGYIICHNHDGILYFRCFRLNEFALGLNSSDSAGYVNKYYLEKLINNYSLLNKKVGQMCYVAVFNNWMISNNILFNMDNYEFGIVAVTGNEHALEETTTPTSGYVNIDGIPCVGIKGESQSLSSPLLICAKNRQAKTFLIQKVTINNGYVYKLFDLDYFTNPFGICYKCVYNNTSYIIIYLPYNIDLYSSNKTFICETQLESDSLDTIDSCIIIGKNTNNVENKPIYINNSQINSSNPIKKDHHYVCTINNNNNVYLTSF